MDIFVSEQQKMLQAMARDFLGKRCSKSHVKQMETDELGYSVELWRDMAELGWMGLAFPEKYGGSGLSFLDLVLLLEEMGRACLPGPFFSTVVLGGLSILNLATEEQKSNFLPQITSGKAVFSLAINEPETDYASEYMKTTAIQKNSNYVIDGIKLFVPYANVADYIICVAVTVAPKDQKLGLFVVEPKSHEVKLAELKTIAADKQFEVIFKNVSVPEVNFIGRQARSQFQIAELMKYFSVAKCGEMVGGAQQVLEMTVEYAKQRIQFDRPIGSFQAIQHHCANMLIEATASKLITYQAAWKLSRGLPCTKEVAAAKAWVSESYRRICALGHQVHGAIGVTEDYDLQLYSRRAKAAEIAWGDADYYKEVMAHEIGL